MKVECSIVGLVSNAVKIEWPEGWPIPAINETVWSAEHDRYLFVRSVTWYPKGNSDIDEAFVYVVFGPNRG